MDKNKGFLWFVVKLGATFVAATALGTWATRRTALSPLWRGVVRAGVAGGVALLARKKAPALATGAGVYGFATLVEGAVEQYDMSRYLAATDAQRSAQLGQGASSGAQTQGAAQPYTFSPPANGPGPMPTGLEGLEAYRANGYAAL